MKNIKLFLTLAIYMLLSGTILSIEACGHSQENGFDICVSAPSCNNLMLRLYQETVDGLKIVDSSHIEMQRAHLKGNVTRPELMYIFMEGMSDYLPIFVEDGHIDVELNTERPAKSTVAGSESHKIFTDFLQAYFAYSDKAMGNMRMAQNASMMNDTLMILHLENDQDAIKKEVIDFQRQFVSRYIQHPIACYILSSHLMYSLSEHELDAIIDSIPQENRNTFYFNNIERYLAHINDQPDDEAEYIRIASSLKDSTLSTTSQRVCKAALKLIDKPYVAGTLNCGADEHLVVSLLEFDCVTFQETCLALALDSQDSVPSFQNFRRQIENVRYVNGKNHGYHTRLHYSTHWIIENTARGIVEDITPKLGGVKMKGQINFMSTHATKYKALCERPELVDSIRKVEQYISQHHVTHIPKAQIHLVADRIPTGSLIFISTNMESLGYMHVGIAINKDGILKMIHASSTGKKVMMTPGSLQEYLKGIPKATGITVLKPL